MPFLPSAFTSSGGFAPPNAVVSILTPSSNPGSKDVTMRDASNDMDVDFDGADMDWEPTPVLDIVDELTAAMASLSLTDPDPIKLACLIEVNKQRWVSISAWNPTQVPPAAPAAPAASSKAPATVALTVALIDPAPTRQATSDAVHVLWPASPEAAFKVHVPWLVSPEAALNAEATVNQTVDLLNPAPTRQATPKTLGAQVPWLVSQETAIKAEATVRETVALLTPRPTRPATPETPAGSSQWLVSVDEAIKAEATVRETIALITPPPTPS